MEPLIRLATGADQQEILSLLNAVFSENQRSAAFRDQAYWNWKFLDSPFGHSMVLVAEMDGRIIGVNNWWPWEFVLRGSVIRAYQPCDSAVHTDYRGKGCFRMLRLHGLKLAQEQGVQLLFNYPNQNSIGAYLALGWHAQQTIPWMIKVLRPLQTVRALFTNAKTESLPMDDPYRIQMESIHEAMQFSNRYDHYLKINRIQSYHEWRYLNHPQRYYGMVSVHKGRKISLAIVSVNQRGPHRELVVVDLLGAPDMTVVLMKEVVRLAGRLRVNFVAVMNNPLFGTEKLWQIGFFRKSYKNMVVLPLDLRLELLVKGYGNWSLMAGMHDSV